MVLDLSCSESVPFRLKLDVFRYRLQRWDTHWEQADPDGHCKFKIYYVDRFASSELEKTAGINARRFLHP